jgi:hypothetical protein
MPEAMDVFRHWVIHLVPGGGGSLSSRETFLYRTTEHKHYIMPRVGVRSAVTVVRALLDYVHIREQGHCLLLVMRI